MIMMHATVHQAALAVRADIKTVHIWHVLSCYGKMHGKMCASALHHVLGMSSLEVISACMWHCLIDVLSACHKTYHADSHEPLQACTVLHHVAAQTARELDWPLELTSIHVLGQSCELFQPFHALFRTLWVTAREWNVYLWSEKSAACG